MAIALVASITLLKSPLYSSGAHALQVLFYVSAWIGKLKRGKGDASQLCVRRVLFRYNECRHRGRPSGGSFEAPKARLGI